MELNCTTITKDTYMYALPAQVILSPIPTIKSCIIVPVSKRYLLRYIPVHTLNKTNRDDSLKYHCKPPYFGSLYSSTAGSQPRNRCGMLCM